MAAVTDPPTLDTYVSQPRREVTYASRRDSLVLVHTPEYPILNAATGQRTGQTIGGIRIQFVDGQLRVPLEGDVVTAQGKRLPAPDVIEWLDKHHLFGDPHEGFFKLPQVAPPVSQAEIERISELAMFHDVEGLRGMLAAEQGGWNRRDLTAAIEKRIAQLVEFIAQLEAQAAAEAEAPAVKKAAK